MLFYFSSVCAAMHFYSAAVSPICMQNNILLWFAHSLSIIATIPNIIARPAEPLNTKYFNCWFQVVRIHRQLGKKRVKKDYQVPHDSRWRKQWSLVSLYPCLRYAWSGKCSACLLPLNLLEKHWSN